MKRVVFISVLFLFSCASEKQKKIKVPYVMVLGVAQDAGYPQINCRKGCCKAAWGNKKLRRMTSCLAIIDPISKEQWILDATPNINEAYKNSLPYTIPAGFDNIKKLFQ